MSTFETMPNPGQTSGLTFDESKFKLRSRRILGEPEVPTMIRFLVSKHIVKTENQAVGILLVVCVLVIIATIMVFNTSSVPAAVIDPML